MWYGGRTAAICSGFTIGQIGEIMGAMPELTRRRYRERQDCWHVYHGDVHVGTIARRVGIPHAPWSTMGLDLRFIREAGPANSGTELPLPSTRRGLTSGSA